MILEKDKERVIDRVAWRLSVEELGLCLTASRYSDEMEDKIKDLKIKYKKELENSNHNIHKMGFVWSMPDKEEDDGCNLIIRDPKINSGELRVIDA